MARKTTPSRTAKSKSTSTKRQTTNAASNLKSRGKAASKSAPGSKARSAAKPQSRSTRAKGATNNKSGAAITTIDHNEIQEWAESRRGTPATVKSTRSKNQAGILRIDFPGFSGGESLQEISWDEWFEKFDKSRLAFLYQDKTKDGKKSRFFKLVKK